MDARGAARDSIPGVIVDPATGAGQRGPGAARSNTQGTTLTNGFDFGAIKLTGETFGGRRRLGHAELRRAGQLHAGV